MSNIIPFQFENTQIRTVIDEHGEPWFVAKDVALTLGYADTKKAIEDNCKRAKSLIMIKGDCQPPLHPHTKLIPEGDIYRLVMRSKLPAAEKFEVWVVEEVLPQIRRTGHYAPSIKDPTLAALVQVAIEVDALKQQQSRINHKTEILETRLQNVELRHRKNIPEGYLAKKHAHHLYGEGLSEEIFHLAMAKLGVPIKNYIHINEDGFESPTFAYLESEIAQAVQTFLDDAVQCAPQTCRSPMLSNKRFRYVKEPVTLQ